MSWSSPLLLGAPAPGLAARGVVLLSVLAVTGGAQDDPRSATLREDAALIEVRTGDGSRFVIAPTGGPPVVHWVLAAPAGTREDPPGLDGLSVAVARAAMAGTGARGSADPAAERAARARLDELEQQRDRLLAAGEPVPEPLLADLRNARAEATALFEAVAWDRELRGAPAAAPELVRAAGGTLLHVTTTVQGLPRVAALLRERREGTLLRDVPMHLRTVREELARRRSGTTADLLRQEVLGLAFAASPWASAWTPPRAHRAVSRDEALSVYRSTQHPARTCHVLTGGFEPDSVAAMLRAVFATTRLPPPPPPSAPAVAERVERRASLSGGDRPQLAIALQTPAGAQPDGARILAAWLAGAPDAWLPRSLRLRGWPDAEVRATFPFPAPGAGLLLIEVAAEPDERETAALLAAVEASLAEAAERGPPPDELAAARARLAAGESGARLGAANLALHLGNACGLEGRDPAEALAPLAVEDAEVVELAEQLLREGSRAIASMEPAP